MLIFLLIVAVIVFALYVKSVNAKSLLYFMNSIEELDERWQNQSQRLGYDTALKSLVVNYL
jgi:cell division protein FtsL